MDFRISFSQSDWERTPQPVRDYITELQATVQRLRTELNTYLAHFSDNPENILTFNGLTDFLVTPYPVAVSTEAFSFEARIKVRGNRAGEFKIIHILGPGQMSHGTNWVLGPHKNVGWLSYQWGGVWWGLIDNMGVFHAIHSGPARSGDVNPPLAYMDGVDSVSVDVWHHIAGTWDGGMMKLYVDGAEVSRAPFDGNVVLATQAYIGAHFSGTSQFFPGELDDVRIWNRGLAEEEVLIHKDGGVIDDEQSLVVNYSTRCKPVVVTEGEARKSGWGALQNLEDRMQEGWMDELPSAQARLIGDLRDHLLELERKRHMI